MWETHCQDPITRPFPTPPPVARGYPVRDCLTMTGVSASNSIASQEMSMARRPAIHRPYAAHLRAELSAEEATRASVDTVGAGDVVKAGQG
jgi:hypothetical protein